MNCNTYYEGESVNRSRIDIKRKTCDIRTWKKHWFLDISTINIDALVPSLYHCVETRSIEVFWLLSQPLPHLRFNLFISETFATKAELLYASNTSHHKRETFLYEYPLHWVLLPTKKKHRAEVCSSVVYSSSTVTILAAETSLWTCGCASATETVMKLDCPAT
jgi:hypothetical protein